MASGNDELDLLIATLPSELQAAVRRHPADRVLEVVLDLGRVPELRLVDATESLSATPVEHTLLEHVTDRLGAFGADNRAGIARTLHRISAIRNRRGDVVGLTLRVGRAVFGTIDMIRDLVEGRLNLLLLGPPGVGKTTKLREIARVLADDFGRRVMIVDTSNEIGGDGDVPHPGIGRARRMQVPEPRRQHAVMIEAVENHMPEVIIVDEIGTEAEAAAARTIAERGVQLIGTAHGTTLENLILNPTLSDLVGGVETVTLSDEEARRRRTSKTITERRGAPTFDAVVELVSRDEVRVHRRTADAVDALLAGQDVGGERRTLREGSVRVEDLAEAVAPPPSALQREQVEPPSAWLAKQTPTRIYPYALDPRLLARVLRDLPIRATVAATLEKADVVLSLRSRADDRALADAAERGVPIHAVKRNSSTEFRRVLRNAFFVVASVEPDRVREAVLETEHAIRRVMNESVSVPLAPRPPELRRLEHKLVSRYHLASESVGSEPMRHLVIYPRAGDGGRALQT